MKRNRSDIVGSPGGNRPTIAANRAHDQRWKSCTRIARRAAREHRSSGHDNKAQARMSTMVEWIAAHALRLWALLLMLALLGGDLAWQHNIRRQRRAARLGHAPAVWRWQGAAFLLLLLGLLFGALVLAIFERQPSALADFDARLAESLHKQLPLPALHVIAVITHMGDTRSVALVAIVVLLVLLFRRHRQLALAWMVALIGVLPINESLKALFQRARPLHDHGFIREPGWSFPSGHAFGAMVFYG
ncbi:MAG: hypothetical protein ABI268_10940, partial [Rhodanobacter sp.]